MIAGKSRKYLAGMLVSLMLAACASTVQELVEEVQQKPVQYTQLSELPFQPLAIGEHQSFRLDEHAPVFAFDTGKSYIRAIALPVESRPYVLVVKSYFVSSLTDASIQIVRGSKWAGDPATPFVFPPCVLMLDDHYQPIRTICTEQFQVASTMRRKHVLLFSVPSGRSWLQTAIRLEVGSRARYAVIFTTKALLAGSTSISRDVWTYGNSLYSHGRAYHIPIGKLELDLVRPENLLSTAYEEPRDLPEAVPGKIFHTRWFSVQVPAHASFHVRKDSFTVMAGTGDYVGFDAMPKKPGIVTFFIYSLPRKRINDDELRSDMKLAMHEHRHNFSDIEYTLRSVRIDDRPCLRLDFTARVRRSFFAPIQGYDIFCISSDRHAVIRIGGNVVYPPHIGYRVDRDALEAFIKRISLQ